MNFLIGFGQYVGENYRQILVLLMEHIRLTTMAVALALIIGVPLGILIGYVKGASRPILAFANLVQAIPSMALLGFSIPLLGIGYKPAIVVVVLYSLLPIIKNTYTGLENISPQTIEVAKGIGLTNPQILFKVKLPLALPVIMAGVRISAVTAVGLMTMAAFIGGGGLGYLVFSGIRTVNNYQILAGAIPAALLALFVDFLGAAVENLVTPKSLLPAGKKSTKTTRNVQKALLGTVAACLIFSFVSSSMQSAQVSDKRIVVGSKDYTEQVLLCHLVADVIEGNTDITVDRKTALGGSQVCFGAMQSGDIDMYVEYSGTAYGDILKHPPISDMDVVYNTMHDEFAEKYDITVLPSLGFNNTYTLAIRPDTAEKYNLTTISDLSKVSKQLIATPCLEFINRQDGLPGLEEAYDLHFADVKALDGSPKYIAIMNGDSDVIDAFSTDGLLKKFELVVLEDDKNFFPPYYATPIIRAEVLQQYPEIAPPIAELGLLLNNETMMELNYQVDELQKEPEAVAREFLEKNNLI